MPRLEAGLEALTDVKAAEGGWESSGAEPWLRLRCPPSPGQWVRLVYSSGLLDPLIRPALRIVGRHQIHDELLPAAMLGRAMWIGRLPEDVSEILISPTLGSGRFGFRVDSFETLAPARAFSHFGAWRTSRVSKYLWGRLRGWDQFARLQARRALGATPLADYESWRRARIRAFEPDFDGDPSTAAPIRFRVLAADAAAAPSAAAGARRPDLAQLDADAGR